VRVPAAAAAAAAAASSAVARAIVAVGHLASVCTTSLQNRRGPHGRGHCLDQSHAHDGELLAGIRLWHHQGARCCCCCCCCCCSCSSPNTPAKSVMRAASQSSPVCCCVTTPPACSACLASRTTAGAHPALRPQGKVHQAAHQAGAIRAWKEVQPSLGRTSAQRLVLFVQTVGRSQLLPCLACTPMRSR